MSFKEWLEDLWSGIADFTKAALVCYFMMMIVFVMIWFTIAFFAWLIGVPVITECR